MARVRTIEISRTFDVGAPETVRYSVTVDVAGTESADRVFENLERVVEALRPIGTHWIDHLKQLEKDSMDPGLSPQYREAVHKDLAAETKKHDFMCERREKALRTLNELGGHVTWVDSKKEWEEELKF